MFVLLGADRLMHEKTARCYKGWGYWLGNKTGRLESIRRILQKMNRIFIFKSWISEPPRQVQPGPQCQTNQSVKEPDCLFPWWQSVTLVWNETGQMVTLPWRTLLLHPRLMQKWSAGTADGLQSFPLRSKSEVSAVKETDQTLDQDNLGLDSDMPDKFIPATVCKSSGSTWTSATSGQSKPPW